MRITVYNVIDNKGVNRGAYNTLAQARTRATECSSYNMVMTITRTTKEEPKKHFLAFV